MGGRTALKSQKSYGCGGGVGGGGARLVETALAEAEVVERTRRMERRNVSNRALRAAGVK